MPHVLISPLCPFIRAQHASLQNPYWIRRDCDYSPRYAGRQEVVERRETFAGLGCTFLKRVVAGRTVVEIEKPRLDNGFEVEEDGPTSGVPDQIWGQASIEALNWSVICQQ